MKKLISSLILTFLGCFSFGQISVTNTQTPAQLINNVLAGPGVTISNITYNGSAANANTIQQQAGQFNDNGTTFPLSSGIVLSNGNVNDIPGSGSNFSSTDFNGAGDVDLTQLSGLNTNDAVVIEFDFVPIGDSVSFRYILASEEYPEFSPSPYNDVFGFFLSGPGISGPFSNNAENIAYLPNNLGPATINNINPTTNSQYYVDMASNTSVVFDGRTVILTTILPVTLQCNQTYHFKMALADGGDGVYDTAIFLEANSFQSSGATISISPINPNNQVVTGDLIEGCVSANITFTNPTGYTDSNYVVNLLVGGTATNGTDYNTINNSYNIPPGQDSIVINIAPIVDGTAEGPETIILSSYFIGACSDTVYVLDTLFIQDQTSFNVNTTDFTMTCPNDSAMLTFTLSTGGIADYTYNWSNGSTNDTTYFTPPLSPGINTFTVDVTDACGTTEQGTINVNVNPAPQPTIDFAGAAAGQNITLCPGQQFNIQILQVNNPYDASAITYNWHPEVSNSNQVTVTAQPNAFFEYVDVFDGCYTVIDSVKINPGGVTINQINVVDALNCPGQASPALGEIEIIPTGFTYTLTGGGLNVGPQPSNQFTNLTGGLTYFVHVEDPNGCFTDTAVFVGTAVTSVTADWVTTTLDSVTCNGTQDGSAEVANIQGGLTPGPYDITWTHQTGDFSQVLGTGVGLGDVVDTLYGGQWVVSVVEQGSGCAWSQTFDIYEPDSILIDTSNYHMPYCFGNSDGVATINVSGGNSFADYVTIEGTNSSNVVINSTTTSPLTLNNLPTDIYTIYVEDIKGCKDSVDLFIAEPAELAIDFRVTDLNCHGINTGVISVDTVYNYQYPNYDSLSYIWNPVSQNGLQGIGAYFNNHLDAGIYEVQITDFNDLQTHCIKTFSFTVEDASPILIEDYVVTKIPLCRTASNQDAHGQISVTVSGGLTSSSTGNDFTNSYWQNNSTGDTWNSTTYPGINSGYYTFYAVNELNCVVDTTFYLDSISPVANFIATSPQFTSDYIGTAVVEVTFENTSENYDYANNPGYNGNNTNSDVDTLFTWYFTDADGNTDSLHTESLAPIIKDYLSEGLYTVCLEVEENLNHCTDSTCIEIQIYDEPELIQANVFTPDGDGTNDYFYFPNQAIIEFSAVITDRWGNVVFEFDDINTKWDGTNMKNGKMCTDGTYFYVYEGESSNGTKYKGQGTVQIIKEH